MLETPLSVFHSICILCLLFTTVLVSQAKNSVHSVLFLIGAFINSVLILFLFQIEFMSLVFLFVYVGAIAVLFLFIIMMLPNKHETVTIKDKLLLITVIICSFFLLLLYKDLIAQNSILMHVDELENIFALFLIDETKDALFFSLTLYNYNAILVVIAGLVLLVSMLGAILLTANFNTIHKSRTGANQLSRSIKTVVLYL